LNFSNVPESGEYEVLVNSSKKKTVETELLEENRNTISNTDKIICINTETKLRMFLTLLQEYDIIENILEKDEKLLNYLSVFVKSDFHNYNNEEVIEAQPIRLKADNADIIYLIGDLSKSEEEKKNLFDDTDIWLKVSKVFLNKRGGKLNPKSMCTQYSKMHKDKQDKIVPHNIEILKKIISRVYFTK
jgi:ASC-1-like (ASCH) protein